MAYDIRRPKRLRRVHAVLKRYGIPIQYSVFVARLSESALLKLLTELKSVIDSRRDDIRVYPIPTPVEVVALHDPGAPVGVFFEDEYLGEFLTSHRSDMTNGDTLR